jgi:hypothetical protein
MTKAIIRDTETEKKECEEHEGTNYEKNLWSSEGSGDYVG